MLSTNQEVEERDMIPELNTVISVSSVLMLALTNNNSNAELREGKQSEPRAPRSLGSSEHIKYFSPHPSMVASGLCSYKYITNRVPNRIPGMIIRDQDINCAVSLVKRQIHLCDILMIVLFWTGSLTSETGCRWGCNDGNDARTTGSLE